MWALAARQHGFCTFLALVRFGRGASRQTTRTCVRYGCRCQPETHAAAGRRTRLYAPTCVSRVPTVGNARRCGVSGRTIRNRVRSGHLASRKRTRVRGVAPDYTQPRAFRNSQIALCHQTTFLHLYKTNLTSSTYAYAAKQRAKQYGQKPRTGCELTAIFLL